MSRILTHKDDVGGTYTWEEIRAHENITQDITSRIYNMETLIPYECTLRPDG